MTPQAVVDTAKSLAASKDVGLVAMGVLSLILTVGIIAMWQKLKGVEADKSRMTDRVLDILTMMGPAISRVRRGDHEDPSKMADE